MLYIDAKSRDSFETFKLGLQKRIENCTCKNYDSRYYTLEALHSQSYPVSIGKIVKLINTQEPNKTSYSSVVRHVDFFVRLEWLVVAKKIHKKYLLIKAPV